MAASDAKMVLDWLCKHPKDAKDIWMMLFACAMDMFDALEDRSGEAGKEMDVRSAETKRAWFDSMKIPWNEKYDDDYECLQVMTLAPMVIQGGSRFVPVCTAIAQLLLSEHCPEALDDALGRLAADDKDWLKSRFMWLRK